MHSNRFWQGLGVLAGVEGSLGVGMRGSLVLTGVLAGVMEIVAGVGGSRGSSRSRGVLAGSGEGGEGSRVLAGVENSGRGRELQEVTTVSFLVETQSEEDAHHERCKWSWSEDYWRKGIQVWGYGNLCAATGRRRSSFQVGY